MKKPVFIIILAVALIVAFFLGISVGKGNIGVNSKSSVVGVYKTDSWNGRTGTLVLYEDGTCQYPSGEEAKWVLKDDVVLIITEYIGTINDGSINHITFTFDETLLSNEEAKAIVASIAELDNVDSIKYEYGYMEFSEVTLGKPETDSKALNMLLDIKGVCYVEGSHQVKKTSEHEAKIMENGLVLNGNFFEKVSN